MPTEITYKIESYRDGRIDWSDLVEYLSTRTYAEPRRYDADRDEMDDSTLLEDGTFEEVDRAEAVGLLTREQVHEITRAFHAAHTER
jgi:hypothetical protein